jgi:hypothetical protein
MYKVFSPNVYGMNIRPARYQTMAEALHFFEGSTRSGTIYQHSVLGDSVVATIDRGVVVQGKEEDHG